MKRYLSACALFLLARSSPLVDFSNVRCGDVLPTPTYGLDGAVFTVCAEEFIRASPSRVYSALLDFSKYEIWNSFVVNVELPAGVKTPQDVFEGMRMTFTTTGLIPLINTASIERVTVLQPGNRFALNAWANDDLVNGTILPAEHPNILTDVGNGWTRIVSYETYYQPGATLVLPIKANLQAQFLQQGKDLKKYVEGLGQ